MMVLKILHILFHQKIGYEIYQRTGTTSNNKDKWNHSEAQRKT
jgi:hypothetical protein